METLQSKCLLCERENKRFETKLNLMGDVTDWLKN